MQNVRGDAFEPFVEDPYPFYASLRHEEPITFCAELDAWLVTSYRDIKDMLLQHDKISSRNALSSSAKSFSQRVLAEMAKGHIPDIVVVNIDKPHHTLLKMICLARWHSSIHQTWSRSLIEN